MPRINQQFDTRLDGLAGVLARRDDGHRTTLEHCVFEDLPGRSAPAGGIEGPAHITQQVFLAIAILAIGVSVI